MVTPKLKLAKLIKYTPKLVLLSFIVESCCSIIHMIVSFQIGAIFFGCCNERFGGCGSVLNVFETFAKPGVNLITNTLSLHLSVHPRELF
jgi:tRNA(Arg) A34 adenosine deaminase TadA